MDVTMCIFNSKYMYSFQKTKYENSWQAPINFKNHLSYCELENAILLPPIASQRPFGDGCILDSTMKERPESYMSWGKWSPMAGQYRFDKDNLESLDGEYLYLGCLFNHYGHLIMDCCTRLWAYKNWKKLKPLFFVPINMHNKRFLSAIYRFLELYGIKEDKVTFLCHPAKAKYILLPEQSYVRTSYYSNEYLQTFSEVIKNIRPSIKNTPEKIYLSRTKLNMKENKEIGSELLDDLFQKLGYTIIYPECETLDNQIYLLMNATHIGLVQGTLIHSLLYTNCSEKELYIVNKSYLLPRQYVEALKFVKANPIFLDFYIAEYPAPIHIGPFLHIFNKNMQLFVDDNRIDIKNSLYFTERYLIKSLLKFDDITNRKRKNYMKYYPSSNPDNDNYFPPELIGIWANDYVPKILIERDKMMEHMPLQCLIDDNHNLKSMLSSIIAGTDLNNIIICSLHLAGKGWTDWSISEHVSGYPQSHRNIEAMKIRFLKNNFDIFYSVYYRDSGWQDEVCNGEMAGTTGKSRKIDGFKIRLGSGINNLYHIQYRAYAEAWLDWRADDAELIFDQGLKAIEIRLKVIDNSNDAQQVADSTTVFLSHSEYRQMNKDITMTHSAELINYLARKTLAKSYIEIGVFNGDTFLNVDIAQKTAVDPNFRFKYMEHKSENTFYFPVTSDAFSTTLIILPSKIPVIQAIMIFVLLMGYIFGSKHMLILSIVFHIVIRRL